MFFGPQLFLDPSRARSKEFDTRVDKPTMDRSTISESAGIVEFQLSLLRVALPGEPPSDQAIEVEHLLDCAAVVREPLQ